MSSVKWIKLSTHMFEDEKIRLIEQMPEADTILIIWVKLLAQAGKTNASGYIYLNENIPYTDEMLATIFNRPLNIVRLALQTFKQFGMLEITDGDFISIANWEKHQNIAGLDKIREQTRQRVARHREKKQVNLLGDKTNKCAYCGDSANAIDHIVPRSMGGEDTPSNIVECCSGCNSAKQNNELANFLNNSIYLKNKGLDKELIFSNPKLMKFVMYDGIKFVTKNVTLRNATEEELELEEELDKEKKENIPFDEVVSYLNKKTSSTYRHSTKKTKTLIKARWNEGFKLDDFKRVIDIKTAEWINDSKMSNYLRPETLFGTKFESYLNQKGSVINEVHQGSDDQYSKLF
jgi:predicted phage replisome organizer/uncharacterized phage protein (TIGR02220 family)